MKKSSDTQPQLDLIIFFLDRNLGREKLPRLLRDAGFSIKVHDEFFAPDEEDKIWLESCGLRKWVVITPDTKILKAPASMKAIGSNRARIFFLSSNNQKAELWAKALTAAYTKIMATIQNHEAPFIARISTRGDVWLVKELDKFGRDRKKRSGKNKKYTQVFIALPTKVPGSDSGRAEGEAGAEKAKGAAQEPQESG